MCARNLLLLEHLFAFPRISVVPGFEQKAFVPYTNAFHAAPPYSTSVVQGIVEAVLPDRVMLADGESIPYEYLIMATGTGKQPLELTTKVRGMREKRALQDRMRKAQNIVVVGGGAYGVREYAVFSRTLLTDVDRARLRYEGILSLQERHANPLARAAYAALPSQAAFDCCRPRRPSWG
jgi:NADH dehydrogenase FAD-containing subunit